MQIVSALFVDGFSLRDGGGGTTRMDLTGVHFSESLETEFPARLDTHLLVLVRGPARVPATTDLTVSFLREGRVLDRVTHTLEIDPGRFAYRLIRQGLTWTEPGTIEARCAVGGGPPVTVPLTVTARAGSAADTAAQGPE
ncbi:MAG TPA: hypothetical protein ENI86_10500 [Acidimicrobiales bacterium]|nr:hypothetical protein [Acidimicrobiales bacterium]